MTEVWAPKSHSRRAWEEGKQVKREKWRGALDEALEGHEDGTW